MRLSLVEHHSSLQLLFAFSLTAILSSTFALPYPTPSPSIQHQHRRAQPPTRNDLLGQSVSSALTEAWIDYYTLDGAFLAEDVANSGACVTIPNTWGILLVTPTTYSDSTLVLYNDASCSTVNREPGGQTGLIVIAIYFTQRPGSLRWTSSLAVTSSPSSMSAIAPTSTTFSGAPTTISVELPPPTSLTSNPSAISTPNKPPGNGPVPTPIHSTFPKALIPPKPLDPSASSGNDPCTHNENDACQKARHVTQFLIVGIAVAVLTVGLMMGGSYYIYKKFYTPEEPPMSSSSFASKSRAPPLPPLATVKNQRRRRGSLDEDFDDEDDEEEGGGGGETFHPNEHGLRFNHRGDNIGGSKSTGSYQYDHSDISLVERVKQ